MSKAPHSLPIRIYYEDTDAGGIVYHASYLRFAERGRTEMLRDAGYDHAALFKETGIGFAVVSMHIEYNAPARLDDLLTIRSKITRIGGASMEMQQDIYSEDRLLTEIKVTLVCIDSRLKPVKVPAGVRAIFERK